MTGEIEFPDEETALAFEAPDWLGRDVTDDPRYANRSSRSTASPERRLPGVRIPARVCRNRRSPSMRRAFLVATLAAGLVVTSSGSGLAATATVKTRAGSLGTFLVGPNGRTLYLFTNDTSTKSTCYDACAQAWPPLLTTGKPKAGGKARASLLGTTKRTDGKRQVTYKGHPLYYYAPDKKAGDTTGQKVGGVWFVVSRTGRAIKR